MFRTVLIFTLVLLPVWAQADAGLQLTNIPFVNGTGLSSVVEGLFYLAIVVAGMFAVVKLVIAGAKYMMSDVVTTKQSALGDIKGAIIGLLLILGTVLILDTINDDITNANLAIDDIEFSFDGEDEGGGDPCDGIEDCVIQTCPFLRWELQCSDWCDNQGGTFIDGGWFSSHQCAVSGADEGEGTNAESDVQITGYVNRDGETVAIDTDTVYTINDPADATLNLEAGEYHNQSGTIVGVQNAPTLTEDIDDVNTDTLEIEITGPTLFEIQLDSGEIITMPCGLLDPPPSGSSC